MNNEMQRLMEKYREGTLSDAEMAELNTLTHRDEVIGAANHRAAGIIRRRIMVRASLVVAAGLLVGGGVWLAQPRALEAPLLAEVQIPASMTVPAPEEMPAMDEPAKQEARPIVQVRPQVRKQTHVQPEDIVVTEAPADDADDPVVMCNNRCDADSVINDIWKFLSV